MHSREDLGGSASHLAYDLGGAIWSGCFFCAKRSGNGGARVAIRGRCGQGRRLSDPFCGPRAFWYQAVAITINDRRIF